MSSELGASLAVCTKGHEGGRTATELTSREEADRYQNLFEELPLGVIFQDGQGSITSANSVAERILGLSLDQMKGCTNVDPRWRAIHEDGSDFPGAEHPAMVALRTGEVQRGDLGVFNPELERTIWISVHAVPQFDPSRKEVVGVFTTFEDVTERRLAVAALAANEELFRVAFENASIGKALMAPDGHPVRVNQTLCQMLGRSEQELLTMNWREFTHPDDLDATAKAIELAARTPGVGGRLEKRYLHKDGSIVWADVTTRAVTEPRGAIRLFVTSIIGITDRKIA